MRKTTIAMLATMPTMSLATPVNAAGPATTGYAEVNGLDMYYEITGAGDPVVLLLGAYMNTGLMQPLTDALAETRRVIAVDLQAHGRTAAIDRPLGYEPNADDVAALLGEVGVDKADTFGYSMGGGVANQLAIQHPERVDRLAVAAASHAVDGVYPELMDMLAEMTPESFADTPWEAAHEAVAPKALPKLVEKHLAFEASFEGWPAEDIAGIEAPTLVISGDADIVRPEHSIETYRLVGGGPSADFMTAASGELAIIPGASHLGVLQRLDLLVPISTTFFDKEIAP
ncbi:MAG: alpha/beta hydrolase [Alphaproteobacteria bacterium]